MYDLMKEETDTPIFFVRPVISSYPAPLKPRLPQACSILLKATTISRKVGGMAVGFKILNQQFRACKSATKCLRPMSL